MPGPDGIPYFCWRLGDAPRVLFDFYRDLVSGQVSALPRDMLEVLMAFLPKGDSRDDVGPNVCRTAENTRPLSMANTDAKLLSSRMCRPLNEVAQQTISLSQACVYGRSMAAQIVRAEAWA
eukprot:2662444-Pyramimonas_sp.AAC.1